MDRSSRSKNRNVLEAFAEFDPSQAASASSADSPVVICSLAVYPSANQVQIYAGTLGGLVILLSLSSSPDAAPSKEIEERKEVVKWVSLEKSPVEAIQVFSEIGSLVALSNGFLFLLDLLLLHPVQKLNISGATVISKRLDCDEFASSDPLGLSSLNSESFLRRLSGGKRANGVKSKSLMKNGGELKCFLAVISVRKLVLLELSLPEANEKSVSVFFKEMVGIEGIKTVAWLDDSVIVGNSSGYALFSTSTGIYTPLFSLPTFSGPPQLKPLFRSKEALLFVDNVGIIVNSFGQPVGGSLVFHKVPDSITEVPPYIAVSGDGWMDLYRKKTGICVQSSFYPKSNGRPCLVGSDDLGYQQLVVVATPFKVKIQSFIYS